MARAGAATVPIWCANSHQRDGGLPSRPRPRRRPDQGRGRPSARLIDGGGPRRPEPLQDVEPDDGVAAVHVGVAAPPPISFSGKNILLSPIVVVSVVIGARAAHRPPGGGAARRRGGDADRRIRLGGMGRRPLLVDRPGRPVAFGPLLRRVGPAGHARRRAPPRRSSFASNDYLGLTQHPAGEGGGHDAIERWGTGAGRARLVVGSRPVHHDLERRAGRVAGHRGGAAVPHRLRGQPRRAVTPSAPPGVRILSDELNHASIIDGVPPGPGRGRRLPPRRRRAPGRPARPGPGRRGGPHAWW